MTDPKHENALNDLEVALTLIPEHEKEAYLQAVQRCPQLFATESDPIRFLRFTNFNAPAAAVSIVRYWKARKDAFGDKAFNPLTVTCDGPLDKCDLALIRSGVSFTPLRDSFGRTLLYYDISRRILRVSVERYVFFLHQYTMENTLSQTEGYVMVIFLGENFYMAADTYEVLRNYMMMFPVKVKAMHIVSRKDRVTMNRIRTILLKTYSKVFHGRTLIFHEICRDGDLVHHLEPHGIYASSVPVAFGGTWTYWNVHKWIKMQQDRSMQLNGTVGPVDNIQAEMSNDRTVRCRLPLKKRVKLEALPALVESKFFDESNKEINTGPPMKSEYYYGLTLVQRQVLQSSLVNWEAKHIDGCYTGMVSLDPNVSSFLSHYISVVLQDLDKNVTNAFVQASLLAPRSVWEEESNPFSFVVCEDFNVSNTAKRLARYWKLRSNVFGVDSFKLLHQTGEGALKRRTDLAVLDTGFVSLLPHDEQGSSVIFIDSERLATDYLMESHKRCLFYIFSVAAENQKSLNDGVTVMIRLTKSSPPERRLQSTFEFVRELMFCLPFRTKAIHVLSHVPEDTGRLRELAVMFGCKAHLHVYSSDQSILSHLERFGLRKSGLPKSVGGDWAYGYFNQWQEYRTRVEWKIPLGLSGKSFDSLPGMKDYPIIEDKRERQRRMNAVHSWRKRARYRIEKADLEDRCTDLIDEHKRLLCENKSLEYWLREARKAVGL